MNNRSFVGGHMKKIPEDQLFDLAMFYKVFSDETRLKILFVLIDQSYCVGDIAELTGVSPSAISHQLRTLRQLNLVKVTKVGKEVYYTLSDHHISIILEYGLNHICEKREENETENE